jgi:hypothetical protein
LRFILAAMFIAVLTFSNNAFAECFPPKEIKTALHNEGLFLHSYGTTDRFIFSIWIGKGQFLVLLEDETIACIAMQGFSFYTVREGRI